MTIFASSPPALRTVVGVIEMNLNRPGQPGFTFVELILFIMIVSAALIGVLVAANKGIQDAPNAFVDYRANELAEMYLEEIQSRRYDENFAYLGLGVAGVQLDRKSCMYIQAGGTLVEDDCSDPANFGERPDGSGPDAETRANYDDVDDYHGLKEGACFDGDAGQTSSALLDSTGKPRAGFRPGDAKGVGYYGFCVQVNVFYDGDFNDVYEANPGSSGLLGTPLLSNAQIERTAKKVEVLITNRKQNTIAFATYVGAYSPW